MRLSALHVWVVALTLSHSVSSRELAKRAPLPTDGVDSVAHAAEHALIPASHVNRAETLETPLNIYWKSRRRRPSSETASSAAEQAVLFHAANFHPNARLARITSGIGRPKPDEPEPYATMELYDNHDRPIPGGGVTSTGKPYEGHRAYALPGTEMIASTYHQPVMFETDVPRRQPLVRTPRLKQHDFVAIDKPNAKVLRDQRLKQATKPGGPLPLPTHMAPLRASHAGSVKIPPSPIKDQIAISYARGSPLIRSAAEEAAIKHYVSKYHPTVEHFTINHTFGADEDEPIMHLKGVARAAKLGVGQRRGTVPGGGITSTGKSYDTQLHRVYLAPGQQYTARNGETVRAVDPGRKAIIFSSRHDIPLDHASRQEGMQDLDLNASGTLHPDGPHGDGYPRRLPWVNASAAGRWQPPEVNRIGPLKPFRAKRKRFVEPKEPRTGSRPTQQASSSSGSAPATAAAAASAAATTHSLTETARTHGTMEGSEHDLSRFHTHTTPATRSPSSQEQGGHHSSGGNVTQPHYEMDHAWLDHGQASFEAHVAHAAANGAQPHSPMVDLTAQEAEELYRMFNPHSPSGPATPAESAGQAHTASSSYHAHGHVHGHVHEEWPHWLAAASPSHDFYHPPTT